MLIRFPTRLFEILVRLMIAYLICEPLLINDFHDVQLWFDKLTLNQIRMGAHKYLVVAAIRLIK